eukprot:366094-Chlamydomonas_euryale.AAC.12
MQHAMPDGHDINRLASHMLHRAACVADQAPQGLGCSSSVRLRCSHDSLSELGTQGAVLQRAQPALKLLKTALGLRRLWPTPLTASGVGSCKMHEDCPPTAHTAPHHSSRLCWVTCTGKPHSQWPRSVQPCLPAAVTWDDVSQIWLLITPAQIHATAEALRISHGPATEMLCKALHGARIGMCRVLCRSAVLTSEVLQQRCCAKSCMARGSGCAVCCVGVRC